MGERLDVSWLDAHWAQDGIEHVDQSATLGGERLGIGAAAEGGQIFVARVRAGARVDGQLDGARGGVGRCAIQHLEQALAERLGDSRVGAA
eukprot:3168608-Prymnesium_polylepis.1